MGRISEDIISQVIDRSDIVEVVSSYIPMKRAGTNFKACCPFHQEKTPSFIVSPQKQIYHCFGCGEGGNIISFVMKQERIDFPEAVRMLAQRVNIEIPQDDSFDKKTENIRHALFRVNQLAVEYFHKSLLSAKTKEASFARQYIQKRGIALDTAKDFMIGFAQNKWDGLITHLRSQNISLSLMEKAGLIIPRAKGEGYYDRFRNRIIFPILDTKSHCRAFGARDLEGSDVKYINSPETPIYIKGHHLYGFHLAKKFISQEDRVIITEGYMDCITPFMHGVKNIVASLGTALTVEQIRLLRRYTKNIIMLYDSDSAGQSAMLRSLDMLLDEGMDVKIANLAEGQDPDSFIRQYGIEQFQEKIDVAESLFDFKFNLLTLAHNKQLAEGKAKIASEMLPTIHRFKDGIQKSEYLRILAQRLAIGEKILINEYNKIGKTLFNRLSTRLKEEKSPSQDKFRSVEHNILKLLLQEESFVKLTKNEMLLEDFKDDAVRNVVSKIYSLFEEGKEINVGKLINSFNDARIQNMISQLMIKDEINYGDKKRMHIDYLKRVKSDRLKAKIAAIKNEIYEAEKKGDQLRLNDLMQEFNELTIKK